MSQPSALLGANEVSFLGFPFYCLCWDSVVLNFGLLLQKVGIFTCSWFSTFSSFSFLYCNFLGMVTIGNSCYILDFGLLKMVEFVAE